jgi:hypothetical protein
MYDNQMNPQNLSLLLSVKKRLKIQDKRGRSIYFTPNNVQRKILRVIIDSWKVNKPAKLIIIKGRQQGITTLCQLIGLALALKVPGFRAYTMAHDRSLATDIFETKIKLAWDQLPPKLKSLYEANRNNTRQLLFDGEMLKSSITVGLSGRGGTYRMLHISEPGMMSLNSKLWREMQSGTLAAGEFADLVIFESTADGGFGQFYQFVKNNQTTNSEYQVIFLCWTDSEEYKKQPTSSDKSWIREYKQLAIDYNLEPSPIIKHKLTVPQFFWYFEKAKLLRDEVKVQYPFSLDEAFVSLSLNYFNLRLVISAEEMAQKAQYEIKNGFKIYKQPTNHVYAIGVDVATGESKDNTSIQVFDSETGEQVAVATGKYDEKTAALMICQIAQYYSRCFVGIEINSFGRAVQNYVIEFGFDEEMLYKRYVTDVTNPRNQRIAKLGWETTSSSRPVLLAEFRNAFEEGVISLNDTETLGEMKVFINNNGKYQAQAGSNDDRVISSMISYQVIKYIIEFG